MGNNLNRPWIREYKSQSQWWEETIHQSMGLMVVSVVFARPQTAATTAAAAKVYRQSKLNDQLIQKTKANNTN